MIYKNPQSKWCKNVLIVTRRLFFHTNGTPKFRLIIINYVVLVGIKITKFQKKQNKK